MIYWNNLDDKGRMMLPAGLRTGMQGTKLYITRGADTCLWMFTPELWEQFKQRILQKTSSFTEDGRVVRSHFLIPVQETEIDRTGRINISLPLRQYAGLTKECSSCEGMEEHVLSSIDVITEVISKRSDNLPLPSGMVSMLEAVVNARKEGREIELYRLYHSGSCDEKQVIRDLSETLRYGRDRLNTVPTPALGKADVVFSTDAAREIYDWFISRMSAELVVRGVSDWKIGQDIQAGGEGDRVTARALRKLPNSSRNAAYDRPDSD